MGGGVHIRGPDGEGHRIDCDVHHHNAHESTVPVSFPGVHGLQDTGTDLLKRGREARYGHDREARRSHRKRLKQAGNGFGTCTK